jgi:hypothetical protein
MLFAALVVLACAAPTPFDPLEHPFEASPKALRDAADALATPAGASMYLLLEEETLTFAKDGSTHEVYRQIYKVLGADALDEGAVVSTSWSPVQEERPIIRARVVARDGKAFDLEASALAESVEGQTGSGIFVDRHTLSGPLPAVSVGALVVVDIESRGHRLRWETGEQRRWQIRGGDPIRLSRYEFRTPREMPLLTRVRGTSATPSTTWQGDVRVTRYAFRDLAPEDPAEAALPAEEPREPALYLSTAGTWNDVARAFASVVEPLFPPQPAHALAGEARSATAQKIVDEVQASVRYTGVERGEAAIIPRPPHETWTKRYGDCKDLAALVIAR